MLEEINNQPGTRKRHEIQKEESAEIIQQEEYITIKEVMKILKITEGTVYNWRIKNILKAYKIGNKVLYKYLEIIKLLEENKVKSV